MLSEAMSAYNAEVRRTQRGLLNSDYDPTEMRKMLAAFDTVGPGPDIRKLGDATLELRRKEGSALIVYVSGGGFCFPGGDAHRTLLDRISAAADMRGGLLQYRLAPEHPFPAAHLDVAYALRVVLEEETAPVFIMCDSAAGALVLCACAQMQREGLRLPDKLVCLSVLTDLAMTGRSNVTNAEADPMFGPQAVIHKVFHYLQGANPTQASVSPLWDEAVILPDILFIAGSTEVMLDDTLRYAEKTKSAGTKTIVSIYDEAPHVFPLLVGMPEAEEAVTEIATFLKGN